MPCLTIFWAQRNTIWEKPASRNGQTLSSSCGYSWSNRGKNLMSLKRCLLCARSAGLCGGCGGDCPADSAGFEPFEHPSVCIPAGNGGLAAGMIYGTALLGNPFHIELISVEHPLEQLRAILLGLLQDLEELCGVKMPCALEETVSPARRIPLWRLGKGRTGAGAVHPSLLHSWRASLWKRCTPAKRCMGSATWQNRDISRQVLVIFIRADWVRCLASTPKRDKDMILPSGGRRVCVKISEFSPCGAGCSSHSTVQAGKPEQEKHGKNIYIKTGRHDLAWHWAATRSESWNFLLADAKEKGVDVVFYRRRCAVQPRHADRSLCFPLGNAGGTGPQKARRACRRQPNPQQDFRGRGLLCGHRFL